MKISEILNNVHDFYWIFNSYIKDEDLKMLVNWEFYENLSNSSLFNLYDEINGITENIVDDFVGETKIRSFDLSPVIEESVELYSPENELVGTIDNYLIFNNVRIKIKMRKLKGYYIIFRGEKIVINTNGRLSDWPKGLFDKVEEQLDALF